MDETFKTCGKFVGYGYEFDDDGDEGHLGDTLVEITEIRDNGEVEIRFKLGEMTYYLDFKLSDFDRAVTEMKAE